MRQHRPLAWTGPALFLICSTGLSLVTLIMLFPVHGLLQICGGSVGSGRFAGLWFAALVADCRKRFHNFLGRPARTDDR
jgi:hypothetical protein